MTEPVRDGRLAEECQRIFPIKDGLTDPGSRVLTLHRHQRDALQGDWRACSPTDLQWAPDVDAQGNVSGVEILSHARAWSPVSVNSPKWSQQLVGP